MIVKLRTVDEGWLYYPVKSNFKFRKLTKEQYECGRKFNTPNVLEIDLTRLRLAKPFDITVMNINKGETIIYANTVAYLLNDDGKTIEKLY